MSGLSCDEIIEKEAVIALVCDVVEGAKVCKAMELFYTDNGNSRKCLFADHVYFRLDSQKTASMEVGDEIRENVLITMRYKNRFLEEITINHPCVIKIGSEIFPHNHYTFRL